MVRQGTLGLLLAAVLAASSACAAPRHGHRHAARHPAHSYAGYAAGRPYATAASPSPTCRYADGTPYDPDIIGGPNHVGDGGPAANLGGFDPCGF